MLDHLCRLCGKITQKTERTSKTQYAKEILDIFNVDVEKDDSEVHPANLCQTCRCVLYRQRKS